MLILFNDVRNLVKFLVVLLGFVFKFILISDGLWV